MIAGIFKALLTPLLLGLGVAMLMRLLAVRWAHETARRSSARQRDASVPHDGRRTGGLGNKATKAGPVWHRCRCVHLHDAAEARSLSAAGLRCPAEASTPAMPGCAGSDSPFVPGRATLSRNELHLN